MRFQQKGVKTSKSRSHLARRIAIATFCAALVLFMATATGCRDSDALKDIIYDQNSDLIDYDNPNKYYINDSTSDIDSDKVSSMEVSDEQPDSDQVQNLVVYSSTPNTVGYIAKKSEFSSAPDFYGIEASESVFFYQSDSIDAFHHAITPAEEEEEPQPDEDSQPEQQQGMASSEASELGGTTINDSTPDDNGAGKGEEDPIEDDGTGGATSSQGVGNDKDFTIAFDVIDLDADIPRVNSVAAYGQYAVIFQMIGGSGALAATDSATLESLNAAGVANSAVAGWSDGGTPDGIDADAIVASGAKYIVTTDAAAYTRQLNDYAMKKLNDAGVQFITLASLNTSTNILKDVETVGEMLQGSEVAAYGNDARSRAEKYESMHDEVVSGANGGLAQDIANDVDRVLQYKGTSSLGFSSNPVLYTVLIDDYDPDAIHTGTSFASGLAYASAGCATTPVSYYIQAGGAINNAAALTTDAADGAIPVLQFATSQISPTSSSWAYGKAVKLLNANALANMAHPLLDSGTLNGAAGENALGLAAGLGTTAMPAVIVTSESIKEEILENSALDNGMYHPYGYATSGSGIGTAGALMAGTTPIWSCIGANEGGLPSAENPNNPLGNSLSSANVVVMPNGEFCDWTEGSVESFLVSGWVSAELKGSGFDWMGYVSDFYSYFYGINVSESDLFD